MKKIILIVIVLLMSGCSIVRIDTSNVDNIVNVVLSKNNTLYNQIGKGYKYYIPWGVSYIDTNKYNDILYSDGNYYYLYIDVINYYYKVEKEYKINNDAYYSKIIDLNGKKGYLEINREGDKYFIEFMYNYAKIETLVDENKINDVILNSSYILSTIKFNDDVIKLMLDQKFLDIDEQYDIFTSKQHTTDFLKLDADSDDIINTGESE